MKKALFWFRRDLRLEDNCALFHCLNENDLVAPVFIFDKKLLSNLPRQDKRVEFVWNNIKNIKAQLNTLESDLIVAHDNKESIVQLAIKYKVSSVYCNHSYEPETIELDEFVKAELLKNKIEFYSYKDIAIFEKDELLTHYRQPFTDFEDYKIAWKKKIEPSFYAQYPSEHLLDKMVKYKAKNFYSLQELGFETTDKIRFLSEPGQGQVLFEKFRDKILPNYKLIKEIPSANGTSFLSVHNRYGTISIRYLVKEAIKEFRTSSGAKKESCEQWINQLILRDFYFQILYNYPSVIDEPFQDLHIPWENNMYYFQKWCEGKTGFPIIDAAMNQLNTTGYIHHKMRVLVSSFLTKILLIDYKFGEDYFATKLIDFDLASNNAGWQWAASSGVTALKADTIINPCLQSYKIDKNAKYIHKFLPTLAKLPAEYLHEPWNFEEEILCYGLQLGKDYPYPIVDIKKAKEKALNLFSALELETNDQV